MKSQGWFLLLAILFVVFLQGCRLEAPAVISKSRMIAQFPHQGLTTCTNCHESQRPSATLMQPPGSAAVTLNTHFAGTDCSSCHNPQSDTVFTFVFAHGANGNTRVSCLPCHASQWPSVATAPSHPQPAGSDCVTCHNNPGIAWAVSGGAGSPHPNNVGLNSCVACHEGIRPSITVMNPPGAPSFTLNTHFAGTDCFQCHNPKSNAVTNWIPFDHKANGNSPASCSACHDSQRPTTIIAMMNHQAATGTANIGTGDCMTCHSASLSVNPPVSWSSGVFNHTPKPVTCSACHEPDRPSGHHVGQDCVGCHTYRATGW